MATLRDRKKIATVSRETSESTRNGQSKHIWSKIGSRIYLQASEQIEGRFTKKLSKQFSRTESHFLGALSKLGELLLNPQVRTFSVAVPGNIQGQQLRKAGTNWGSFPTRSLSQSGVICLPHWQSNWFRAGRDSALGDRISRRDSLLLPCDFVRETKEDTPYKSATFLQLKHPCDNQSRPDSVSSSTFLRRTAFQPISTTISTESHNCRNPPKPQCPPLTGNQKNPNCFKLCTKQVWKSKSNSRMKRK